MVMKKHKQAPESAWCLVDVLPEIIALNIPIQLRVQLIGSSENAQQWPSLLSLRRSGMRRAWASQIELVIRNVGLEIRGKYP